MLDKSRNGLITMTKTARCGVDRQKKKALQKEQ